MTKKINKIIFFIFVYLYTGNTYAVVQTAADELSSLLDNMHTMQASFKQFAVNRSGQAVGQKSMGSMALERPGKFRWEIVQPNKQLIIVNNNKTLIYDIDLAQVTKRRTNYSDANNSVVLLNGAEKLKQMFKVTKSQKSGNGFWFELKSKKNSDQDDNCQLIKIFFNGNGQLKTMLVSSDIGQKIEIDFYNVVVNSSIAKNKFEFIIPKNVDVLDEG